jgi:hypothetical protein
MIANWFHTMKKAVDDKQWAAVGCSVVLGRFGVVLDRFGGVISWNFGVVAMIRIVLRWIITVRSSSVVSFRVVLWSLGGVVLNELTLGSVSRIGIAYVVHVIVY